MVKKALLFGATGLTGNELLNRLLQSDYFDTVVAVGRRKLAIEHPKLTQLIADYESIENHKQALVGDVLFCCLGTTIRKAGSREKFREVDLYYPQKLIDIAVNNQIRQFIAISSMGADADSSNFYLQTKGQMEQSLLGSQIPIKTILRPSLIMGKRQEFRLGESIAIALMKALGWLLMGKLKKYRGIQSTSIAQTMLLVSLDKNPPEVIESDAINELIKRYN